MSDLQATWTPEGTLFFWASRGELGDVIGREVPGLVGAGESRSRVIAHPGTPPRRRYTAGLDVTAHAAAAVLARIPASARVTDSVRCWAQTSLLALELAAEHRIVPSVREGEARWRALLGRTQDRDRFETLAAALPVIARAAPPSDRGSLTVPTARYALRRFLDDAVDGTYRTDAYPGSARGWELQLAEALRSVDPAFVPRDARFQGIPGMLEAWVSEAEAATLRLGLALSLPTDGGDAFRLQPWVYPADDVGAWIPVEDAWTGGQALVVGEAAYDHPAHGVVRGLARAARIFPLISECLTGPRPRGVTWNAHQVFAFVTQGLEDLRDAGIDVRLPEEFAEAGRQRLRARIHVVAEAPRDGNLDLGRLLRFRWEVVLGDKVIDGNEFADLVARKEPVVRFRGGWVLLDPAEVAKLPDGLPQEGALPAAVALRAILAGEY